MWSLSSFSVSLCRLCIFLYILKLLVITALYAYIRVQKRFDPLKCMFAKSLFVHVMYIHVYDETSQSALLEKGGSFKRKKDAACI